MKKALYTLCVDNYSPEITALTFPWLKHYAEKIGASFNILYERKFPDMPVTYEKLQLYELSQENDWTIYIDADALIHPDCPDFTSMVNKDTIVNYRGDFAPIRWKYNNYMLRDGRHFGMGNWFTIASDWCSDLWQRPENPDPVEICKNIYPCNFERLAGVTPEHLIDDYLLSVNIARYGLKLTTMLYLLAQRQLEESDFYYHEFLIPAQDKVSSIKEKIEKWEILSP